MDRVQATTGNVRNRKRKAENQDNERLTKRLGLLNLERNGNILYVPVEQPSSPKPNARTQEVEYMQLDDSKHKVYIHDIDAELSSSDESDEGRLVFLPDIKKHLRESRIPPSVLANRDGELAGMNKEMVLYRVPSSLTVPEEQDSVRKAIIETRARARKRQEEKREEDKRVMEAININGINARDWFANNTVGSGSSSLEKRIEVDQATIAGDSVVVQDDPDAMDMD